MNIRGGVGLAFALLLSSALSQAQGVPDANAQRSNPAPNTPAGQASATPGAPGVPASRLPALPAPDAAAAAVDQVMPLSPAEIRKIRKRLTDTKRAAGEAPYPAKPVTCSVLLDMSPGATPPVIRISAGSGAMLTFYDLTGAEWPIKAIKNFNDTDFGAEVTIKDGAVLSIEAKSEFGQGNVGVVLDGVPKAVVIALLAGQKATDYQCDMRVPMRGPKAKPEPVPLSYKPVFNHYLSDILDGVPPPEAKPLQVSGGPAQAWLIGGQMVIRSRMTLISPEPQGRLSSPDGTHACEAPFTSAILMTTDDGQERQLVVTGD